MCDDCGRNCEGNIVDSALEAGKKIAEVKQIVREEGDNTTVLIPIGFKMEKISNDLERPVRKKGNRSFIAVESFNSYVNKHSSPDETIIIADESEGNVKAILNDHGESEASWGDHTALLTLGFSKQFTIWLKNTKERRESSFDQESLAEFLEENRSDFMCGKIEGPDGEEIENISALELSKMILDLQSTAEEKLSSKIDRQSGRRVIHFENEEVGQQKFSPPPQFVIAIPVYKSADPWQVTIKLFYRTQGGAARFWYIIDQIEMLKEKAFDKICKRIEKGSEGDEVEGSPRFEGTGIEVYKGPNKQK